MGLELDIIGAIVDAAENVYALKAGSYTGAVRNAR